MTNAIRFHLATPFTTIRQIYTDRYVCTYISWIYIIFFSVTSNRASNITVDDERQKSSGAEQRTGHRVRTHKTLNGQPRRKADYVIQTVKLQARSKTFPVRF